MAGGMLLQARPSLTDEESACGTMRQDLVTLLSIVSKCGACRFVNRNKTGFPALGLTDGENTGIDIASHAEFDWAHDASFSIEFWVRTSEASTAQGNEVVIGRNDSGTNLHWYVGLRNGGAANFALVESGGDLQDPTRYLTGTSDLTDGYWHHVAAVRDGAAEMTYLYVDGVLENSRQVPYTAGFDSESADLNIGWLNIGYNILGLYVAPPRLIH